MQLLLIINFKKISDYEFIPNPGLVYRVTGGVLDFYIFFGPDPESVIQQFTQVFFNSISLLIKVICFFLKLKLTKKVCGSYFFPALLGLRFSGITIWLQRFGGHERGSQPFQTI